ATRDGVLRLAAQRRAQPGIDEPVEDRAPGTQQHTGTFTVLLRGAVSNGGLGRRIEDLTSAFGVRLLAGVVEDLLEHPWNGQDERRLERRQLPHEVCDVGGVTESGPAAYAADLDDPSEDVGQRQEQQGCRVLGV